MRFLIATAAAAALLAPYAAQAEEQEVIVVTATRTPTPLERLPARVDVISRADIEAEALTTLPEALGADAVQSGGAGQQTSLFLRGGNSNQALALFDGIRLNDAANPTAAYDFGQDTLGGLDRVEVLRGPASTIYGSDAVSGVINMIPRIGGRRAFEPFLEAGGGSFDTWRALLGATGTNGGLSYGVSAESFETAGFDQVPSRMATHTGNRDGSSMQTLTASAREELGSLAFDFVGRYREAHADYDTLSGGPFFDLRADDPDLHNHSTQWLWRLGAELSPSDAWTLRAAGGEVRSEREEVDGGFSTNTADSTRDFADLTAHWSGDGASLTGGLSIERNDIDTTSQFSSPLSVDEDQRAAYAIGQVDLGQHLTATGSARVDDYDGFGTHATYSLGAVFDYAPWRFYASYGTAFKAPSLLQRYDVNLFNIGNPDLKPEQSRSLELGADWVVFSNLRAGASYYQTRVRDLIDYDFGALQNINVGQADLQGAEAYVEATPLDWARLRVAYNWTDARDGETNERLARRPDSAWRFEAHFTPVDRLEFALTWQIVGARRDVIYDDLGQFVTSNGHTDAYSVGALAATFDLTDSTQVFARVDNIADETYEQPNGYAGSPRGGFLGVRSRF